MGGAGAEQQKKMGGCTGKCVTAGPDKALVLSGCGRRNGTEVLPEGGCACILPFCQQCHSLALTIRTIDLKSDGVLSKKGVEVTLHGVSQVRFIKKEGFLREAATQFLQMEDPQIDQVVQQTMEGHQRAIIGSMTMEALYSDRHEFANQVREVCKEDMQKMGMEVVSYVITTIMDDKDYFNNLGVARTVEVEKNATVGREKYESEIKINKAMCNSQVEIEKVQREQEANAQQQRCFTTIAEAKKEYTVKNTALQLEIRRAEQQKDRDITVQQAQFDQEINTVEARAKAARDIEEKKQQTIIQQVEKEVIEATKIVEVEAKKGETNVAREEVERQKYQSEAEITVVTTAKAGAKKITAQAEAEVKTVIATADATKVRTEAGATAESTTVVGAAQADITRQKGEAEAAAMTAKASAWKQYSQGAYIDMILQQLPEIAMQIAQPLAKTEKIVMISNGPEGSGAGKLTREITTMVSELPAVAEGLTGIDIKKAISGMAKA